MLLNGRAVAINWAHDHAPAVLEALYPGEEGGTAIAEALFGDYNPGGVQVYVSANRPGYPLRQLAALQRIHLPANTSERLTFTLPSAHFTRVLDDGTRVLEPGGFTLFVGGGQPGLVQGIQTSVEIQ